MTLANKPMEVTATRPRIVKIHTFKATAYCFGTQDCHPKSKITASGKPVRHGIIAADPKVLPLGKKVKILLPKSVAGVYYVQDTGSAIKGNRIDIWMAGKKLAMNFGKQVVKLIIL